MAVAFAGMLIACGTALVATGVAAAVASASATRSAAAQASELPPAEAKLRDSIAKAWADFDQWRAARGDPAADDPALLAKRKEVAAAVARLHGRSFDLALKAKAPARAEAALREQLALQVDPKAARADFAALLREAEAAKWNEVAARWLAQAHAVDPDGHAAGKYQEPQRSLGKRDVILLGGRDHPLVAYVSLPADWTPKAKGLPIVVAVEGAGSNFAGCCRLYRDSRGARAAIAVTPCTFSNTNDLEAAKYPWYDAALVTEHAPRGEKRVAFDAAGLAAVLAELRRDWGAGEALAITGFSGGGALTYWWTLRHPEQLALAVGCCANYSGLGSTGAKPVANGGAQVLLLTGEKDEFNHEVFGQKPGILGQTDAIEQQLGKLGFTRVTRRSVAGAGHGNFAHDVWAAFLPK